MKIIKYNLSDMVNLGTEEAPLWEEVLTEKKIFCADDRLEDNIAIALREAYNSEYAVEDDGIEEIPTPSQLDIIEAQVTYTAMMTDTLLEV
jgi:hypothetical protein